jgi:putative transposase
LRFAGVGKRAELLWDAGRACWYFSFAVEALAKPLKKHTRTAAIDLGVRVLASLSIEGKDLFLHFLGRDVLKDWDCFGRQIAEHQQELSHRPKEQRSSKQLRRLYQKRKARMVSAWEAMAVRMVSWLRLEKVGVVYLGYPKGILREAAYSKEWNGRIHSFWSFDQVLKIIEKHLVKAGIASQRANERGTSSHCPWCQSDQVTRAPRHVLACQACTRKYTATKRGQEI